MSNFNNKDIRRYNLGAKGLSYGGISVALILILMYLSSLIRTNRISVLFISSVIVGLIILICGIRYGCITYLSVSILSLFLITDKIMALSFTAFFGAYPIVKLYIERLRNLLMESLLKTLYLIFTHLVVYFIFPEILKEFSSILRKINIYNVNNIYLIAGITLLLIVSFFIYDVLLSKVMHYVSKWIKKLD